MSKARKGFDLGERVRVWYRSARKWKVATIRAWIFLPYSQGRNPDLYQVRCNGKKNPRYYRAEDLQAIK
ncbi:MAG: hypothetical protein HC807_08480 [Gammaproteobacteria bacterium]|nr:hypothetical protein [Gammaproteobacteria bacterium]